MFAKKYDYFLKVTYIFIISFYFNDGSRHIMQKIDQFKCQFISRGNYISNYGLNGTSRHTVEFSRFRILNHHHTVNLFYGFQAQTSIRAHS